MLLVFEYQLLDSTKIMCQHSSITRQADGWIEPELAFTLRSTDVDVCWFIGLIGIEMKPERSYSQDCRHANESGTCRQPCDTFLPNIDDTTASRVSRAGKASDIVWLSCSYQRPLSIGRIVRGPPAFDRNVGHGGPDCTVSGRGFQGSC
jgi:hypothetical protein